MIAVQEVELGVIFPDDRVRMVLMQPYVHLLQQEPFQWPPGQQHDQVERIRATLGLALAPGPNTPVASVTVLPEYSVPGLVGLEAMEDELDRASCTSGTVVISGLHGLSHAEYVRLWGRGLHHQHPASDPDRATGRWVSCCVVLAKPAEGPIRRWIQPKLRRCREEEEWCPTLNMFEGGMVYLFKCQFADGLPCRFLVFSCFDWIAPSGGNTLPFEVLDSLNGQWEALGQQQKVDFVFVLQYNPLPNDPRFLQGARDFLVQTPTHRFVTRDSCVVVFANAAGRDSPGPCARYGDSSLFFAPELAQTKYNFSGCPPTYRLQNELIRGANLLQTCGDALLRERGACVHTFSMRPPQSVQPINLDRRWPLSDAKVHTLSGSDDPRTPGGPVPAVVKWTGDELDALQPAGTALNVRHLRAELDEACGRITTAIRRKDATLQEKCPYAASASVVSAGNASANDYDPARIVDVWNNEEKQALDCAVRALSILDVFQQLDVGGSPAHASLQFGDSKSQVVVVTGRSHDDCYESARKVRRRLGNVVTLLISNEVNGSSDFRPSGRIDDSSDTANILDDGTWVKGFGYGHLVDVACKATSVDQFRAELGPLLLMEGRNPADAA